ncbi:MAG TPA: TetR/AcrR family transcriptional regulator [Cytophagales bacterium]|jgi:TetR/AcrR family transcriptional regulator, transcriptional repressor for nem operon|nr:TetR/AcrR family transcriptional regulator [Cytophagales bacterium]
MRNREETIGVILKQAGHLFNSHGYKATSIGHITQATGYTKGAIYRHFKSKEKLEAETLTYLTSLLFENLSKRIKEEKNAGDKLRAVLSYFESYITKPPIKGGCPLLNAAIEADDGNPMLRKKAHSILTSLKESIIHILNRGIEFKQIKKSVDKEYVATVMIAGLEGAIMMSKLSKSDHDIQIVVKHLNQLITSIEA